MSIYEAARPATNPLGICLDGRGQPNDLVGGKAASLDGLIGRGVNVPPTGVITTRAYREFTSEPSLARFIERWRAAGPVDPAGAERARHEVDQAFLQAPMPARLRREILRTAREVGRGGAVAVRSSATAEDTAAASFAGQYRSELNRRSDDEILTAVRLVWASLWHPAPRSYRAFRQIDESNIAMAVVLMAMVDARWAGVVFTADPGGETDHVRIEAVPGLAEDLVSGAVTPEAAIVARSRAARRWPAHLAHLDPVVDLALSIEEHLGTPQDIEWALSDDGLAIVQARPITTTANAQPDPFDSARPGDDVFTTAGISEMVPGVLPPLEWSLNGPALEHGFRQLFAGLVELPEELGDAQALIVRIRGRAAMNLSLLERVAGQLPGASAADIERQYFGRVVSAAAAEDDAEPDPPGLRGQVQALRELRVRRNLAIESDLIIETARMLDLVTPDLEAMTDDALVGYRNRVLDLGWRAIAAEVAVAAASAASYRSLELQLGVHLPARDAAAAVQRLTRHGNALPGVSPKASAAIFGGPTWDETGLPATMLESDADDIRRNVAPHAEAMASIERQITSSWKYRLVRVLTGQVVDVRRRILRRFVGEARDFLARREETKRAVLRIGGEVRRSHVEMARRLAERGAIARLDDASLLTQAELGLALLGARPSADELARRQSHLERHRAAGPLPLQFVGDPARADSAHADGSELAGWAASAGAHRGRAVVLDAPDRSIDAGTVLVARTTDPSWTPLFLSAGAIVVEEGGPLSHAAIVARELGIPAVLNIPGVVDRLRRHEGEVIVDGSAGRVVIVDAAPGDHDRLSRPEAQ